MSQYLMRPEVNLVNIKNEESKLDISNQSLRQSSNHDGLQQISSSQGPITSKISVHKYWN